MPDYSKGKIYKLCSNQTDQIYIGSTTQELSKRFQSHKGNYSLYLKDKYQYISSFEIIKFDDVYIELIQEYPCESKTELEKYEGQIIKNTINCINTRVAGRTIKEYKKEHPEKVTKYYQQNKEKVKQRAKEYKLNNKEKIKKYNENNKEKIKETRKKYREDNKDKIKEFMKKYREDNKDKIKKHEFTIIQCDCGVQIIRKGLSRHKKTTKHLDIMKNINSDTCGTETIFSTN